MIFLLILGIIIVLVIFYIVIMNNIRALKVKIEESQADIEVYLVKRYDILMESVKVAKKYIEHEKDIMINITKIRKGTSINELNEEITKQEEYMSKFFATAESYPDLYSNELFKTLQIQISDTNEHLSASKRICNSNISIFNQYIVKFPISLVANILNEPKIEFLKDSEIEKKTNISIEF